MSEFPPEVSRVVKGAGAVFPLLAFLFWLTTPLGPWDALLLSFLLELLPVMAVAQLPLIDEEEDLPRIPVYLSSGGLILGVGWLALVVGGGSVGDEAMGLTKAPLAEVLGWTAGLLAGVLLLLLLFYIIRRGFGLRESPLLQRLLPRTAGEKGIFALLSLAAGVGEELAYRGYLIPVLAQILGSVWGAALLSSAIFGVLHAYQGFLGIARTGLLGLGLAVSFILSGSLWPAIAVHAILDLMAGLVLGDILLRE